MRGGMPRDTAHVYRSGPVQCFYTSRTLMGFTCSVENITTEHGLFDLPVPYRVS